MTEQRPRVASAGGPAVAVHDLSKRFGAVQAVAHLSFTAPRGAITALVGPDGAGKTTTLEMLLGRVRPDTGSTTIGASPLRALPVPTRGVGAVLDTRGPHPVRGALDSLRVYAAAAGVPDERARHALRRVGLTDTALRATGTSVPHRRLRLRLATALPADPLMLVLDEPADGLDTAGIAWLRQFLVDFVRPGRTVLIASRGLTELAPILDHVVVVARGAVVHEGPLTQLRAACRDRICVASSDPYGLATALAAAGIVDVRRLPDGRVAVAGADAAAVGRAAAASGATVYGAAHEHVDLAHVLRTMTEGPRRT
ncbi:ATP-binding cassette domain-containing protein [Rhodococcus sp. SGAir0479]|uniref:ATP-binding cassette domain-containing protein n=1 Tax=Rhodococcus sp. SGAir0479 TaxID=2567884 RepID=UPI0010CCFB52|nr:ATP-binding cassette domain-containing protein [Rhodococcus sp. SGAir0479]QCQ90342.1 ATP-binding cassette domain-containing protein [Rhodococcus sp. SGAir0479]